MRLKETFEGIVVYSDIALDPYSSDGHDGIVSTTGEILNDQTVAVLIKQVKCLPFEYNSKAKIKFLRFTVNVLFLPT